MWHALLFRNLEIDFLLVPPIQKKIKLIKLQLNKNHICKKNWAENDSNDHQVMHWLYQKSKVILYLLKPHFHLQQDQKLFLQHFEISNQSSQTYFQDRSLPPGTEHIYLNSEAVGECWSWMIFHHIVINEKIFCFVEKGLELDFFIYQVWKPVPLKVRSFAVGAQIQERQKREVKRLNLKTFWAKD